MEFGIIGAMDVEVSMLVERLEQPEKKQIGSITYHSGLLNGREVAIAKCGVGKVNAAICAQTMILAYSPQVIINTGVAGGVGDGVSVGDLVIGTDVVEHDMDTTPLGEPPGYLDVVEAVRIPCNRRVAEALTECAQGLSGVSCTSGTVASGDQFINSFEKKQWLKETFHAACAEMEGASIGHVCFLSNVPFGIVRAISDGADGNSHMDFEQFTLLAAERSTALMLQFTERYKGL